jgi:uncharacterized protein YndB with AHSA1/START domain
MTPPEISFEVEVPGTPEEVWDAIATGPGISGWFVQTEIADDRMTQYHGNGFDQTSRIVASERPLRFAYEDDFQPTPDDEARVVATEFLVEARSGATCVVRLVQSGFGSGSAWERAVESFKGGWPSALDDLRLFLTHFTPGEPVAGFATGVQIAESESWESVLAALGLPAEHEPGERVETGAGTPPFAGTVSRALGSSLSLLLDAPGRGMGYLGVGGPGAEVFFFVRGRFFGEHAAATARDANAAWEAWLASASRLATV